MVALTQQQLQELLRRAQDLHRAGDLDAARIHYSRLVESVPANADLRHLLGVVEYQRGEVAAAIAHYRHALELRPAFASARNNLGLALRSAGDLEGAAGAFEAALAQDPAYGECAYNLAALRQARAQHPLAEDAYRVALAARPDWPELLANYGDFLRSQGRLAEAQPPLQRAAELRPGSATMLGNLALLRLDQARHAEARGLAEKAAALEPANGAWWGAAGTAARLMLDAEGAVPHLRRATGLAPGDARLLLELALVLQETGDDAAAQAAFDQASALAPGDAQVRWARALSLPVIVEGAAEAKAALARLDDRLDALEASIETGDAHAQLEAAAAASPFALHYLSADESARQRRHASLVARAVRRALPQFAPPPARPDRGGGRVRVGFVSSYLRDHVVARFFAALITGLDAAEFERFVWFTGEPADARTRDIASSVDRFEHTHAGIAALAEAIRDAHLDVLVYPDVGLDPRQLALAALRLAPVQAALYGHPVTTGLDSIDDFLSGELLETPSSAAHYSEKLVRLPGLGAQPWAPPGPGDGAWMRALRQGARPLLACPQNLMKITPHFDATLAALLAATGARLVLFDRGASLTARYRARLARALSTQGVDPGALHFERARPYREYLAGLAAADLVLDTPDFSGGGTSLDALGIGAAVLCFEGGSARSRQTSAMLRLLEVPELIAADAADYVRRASELVADRHLLAGLRAKIAERAPALFDSRAAANGFASYLRQAR